ncbi:MBL fold metallo-hydrolase [Micromonospora sp. NPDC005979]|uniref:MBL fold metallo-hydrolase n=1 Tax=Micromonospora sp. NPDC005979 TaxID=3156726 RepID=UPI0033B83867
MRITRFTHSCVRVEHDGAVLVIDPGTWSEPRALVGADAVLVTHEHTDHVDVLRLAGLGVPVYAPEGARLPDLAPLPVSGAALHRRRHPGERPRRPARRDPRRSARLSQPRLPGR